jgi:type I restriction enzyme M protein
MTPEPRWVDQRYEALRDAFGDDRFTLERAAVVLAKNFKDNKRNTTTILSELRKAGLLNTEADASDSRKKHYKLLARHTSEKSVTDNLFVEPTQLTRSDIESILKKAADLIRTRVDYKFILILLFLKRISDKWELEYESAYKEARKDGFSEKDAREEARSAAYHDFDIPQEYLWESLRKDVANLPEKFSKALKALAERNPELKDILDSADFVEFTTNRENAEILRQLVELFSERKLHHVAPDVLGDAYEWILRYFAPQKAKEGEVYTPREVIRLLVEILAPKPGEHVYDPACGSGGMLIMAYKYAEDTHGREAARKVFLYGQEANQRTLALSRMNMHIHDIRDVNLASGDTLLYPKFKDKDGIRTFHAVIANPPWNQDGYDDEVLKKGEFWKQRFSFGMVPRQSADWAWVQHMLASARNEDGRVGVLLDNGCLFRSGKEESVRAEVVKADLLDAVILLPEKLFYNTGAPGVLLILTKNKPNGSKGKVLFIDATRQFARHPEMKKLNRLGEDNISAIRNAYTSYGTKAGFARLVPDSEIEENEFNLSVPRYIESTEQEEEVAIPDAWEKIQKLEAERDTLNKKLNAFLKDLGV